MSGLVVLFVAFAALLWMAMFGYPLALAVWAWRRPPRRPVSGGALPPVTVVMAVRDEAAQIEAKLADLAASDYPRDRLRVVIAEGGSRDDTAARLAAAAAVDPRLTVLRVARARHKADQLCAALAAAEDEFLVATDADARLAPDCIRRLVETLVADETTAVVGAWVEPDSELVEERLHWWLLNRLWWLEGEAIGAAGVSGVCCALRRSAVTPPVDRGDDIAMALAAGAHGHRVRICRTAHATELRVPQTSGELLRFRLRRGQHYLEALHRAPAAPAGRRGWRLARAMRLFHFQVTPFAAAGLALATGALAWTAHWPAAAAVAAAFALPLGTLAGAALPHATRAGQRHQLVLAAGRLVGLTWMAMLAVPRRAARGGAAPAPDDGRAPRPHAAAAAWPRAASPEAGAARDLPDSQRSAPTSR